MSDREQQIRQKAYELWEAAGKPEGRQAEHWAEAERQLSAQDFAQSDAHASEPQQMGGGDGSAGQVIADVPVVRKKKAPATRKNATDS